MPRKFLHDFVSICHWTGAICFDVGATYPIKPSQCEWGAADRCWCCAIMQDSWQHDWPFCPSVLSGKRAKPSGPVDLWQSERPRCNSCDGQVSTFIWQHWNLPTYGVGWHLESVWIGWVGVSRLAHWWDGMFTTFSLYCNWITLHLEADSLLNVSFAVQC